MQFKPKTWTHHHTFRCLHLSGFLAFVGFCILVGGNLLSVALPTRAETTFVVGQVGLINPGPAAPPGPALGSPTPKSPYTPYTTVSAKNIVGTQFATYKGEVVTVPVIKEGYLTLFGSSNTPQGNISINIPTNPVRVSGVSIKNDGTWEWSSPIPLSASLYDVVLTIMDGQVPELKSTEHYLISITSEKNTPPTPSNPTATPGSPSTSGPTSAPGNPLTPKPAIAVNQPSKENPETIFPGIMLTVDSSTKNISQGGRLVARLTSTPFPKSDATNSLVVNFKIISAKGQTITDTDDTLDFVEKINYVKTFYTDSRITAGEYKIIATTLYKGASLSSADTFEIIQKSVVSLGSKAVVNYTGIVVALTMIVASAVIIGYLELIRVINISKIIRKVDGHLLNKAGFL